jgi:Fungal chitosanase of glycosyl hydrolase group 75
MKSAPGFLTVRRISVIVAGAAFIIVAMICGYRRTSDRIVSLPSPTPLPILPRGAYDTAKLFNGLLLTSRIEGSPSGKTAWETASDSNSYSIALDLKVRWPAPATNSLEIETASPGIRAVLPDLDRLLSSTTARISPAFLELQERKERSLLKNLSALQHLPYRSSVFDCQTILETVHPDTARRALLVQAVMNVNTDGSDGDRNLPADRDSATFQPQTSYRWTKRGDRPNPFLPIMETELEKSEKALGSGTYTSAEKALLEENKSKAASGVDELKRWSFLVGAADPFIVLPSFMVGKHPGQPKIGDYAVVIYNGTLYPAVLGDIGPNNKIGEASLRICKAIDPDSGGDKRPVTRPSVIYLVFPDTADRPFTSPDYSHWLQKCRTLWKEIGGSESSTWHEWTSLEKPWPTPSPLPTETPAKETSSAKNVTPISPGTNPAGNPLPFPTSALPSPATNQ